MKKTGHLKKVIRLLSQHSFLGILRRIIFVVHGRIVSLNPKGMIRGYALLSYTTVPFTFLDADHLGGHSNYWEVREMARVLLMRGYSVDIIDHHNRHFVPKKPYAFFFDISNNIERIAPLLPPECIKIFFATGSYWEFHNNAEKQRIENLRTRRGVTATPRRQVPSMDGIAYADVISGVCGEFPTSTYAHLKKPLHMIPVSSTHEYAFPKNKNIEDARKKFLWFGGSGAIHKGLDLVLEAFKELPEYTLIVCGKFEGEEDFVSTYHTELYETPNIKSVGYIDPGSPEFDTIRNSTIAVISVSSSEGCASSIILAMHAGLIPIATKENGVAVENFGISLKNPSTDEITHAVQILSEESPEMLARRSYDAWSYARKHHTRTRFSERYVALLDSLEQSRGDRGYVKSLSKH